MSGFTARVTEFPLEGAHGIGEGKGAAKGRTEGAEIPVIVVVADGEAFVLRELETQMVQHEKGTFCMATPSETPVDLAQIMEKGRYDNAVGRERQRRGLHDPVDLQAVLSQPALLLVMPAARLHEIAGRFHEGNDLLHPRAAGREEDFSNLIFSGHRRDGWFKDKDTQNNNTYHDTPKRTRCDFAKGTLYMESCGKRPTSP